MIMQSYLSSSSAATTLPSSAYKYRPLLGLNRRRSWDQSPTRVVTFCPVPKLVHAAVVVSHSRSLCPLVVKSSASAEADLQPDTDTGGGGGGVGGDKSTGGGGGGGGGGDKYDSGDGGADEESSSGGDNKKMSMSQKLTLGYAALVGLGGLMGYLKSGSYKSLLAGGLSSLLLYYVYTQLPTSPVFASSIGLGLSAALLVVMGSRFKKSGKIFPAGVVSLVSLIMSGGYLHGVFRSMH